MQMVNSRKALLGRMTAEARVYKKTIEENAQKYHQEQQKTQNHNKIIQRKQDDINALEKQIQINNHRIASIDELFSTEKIKVLY